VGASGLAEDGKRRRQDAVPWALRRGLQAAPVPPGTPARCCWAARASILGGQSAGSKAARGNRVASEAGSLGAHINTGTGASGVKGKQAPGRGVGKWNWEKPERASWALPPGAPSAQRWRLVLADSKPPAPGAVPHGPAGCGQRSSSRAGARSAVRPPPKSRRLQQTGRWATRRARGGDQPDQRGASRRVQAWGQGFDGGGQAHRLSGSVTATQANQNTGASAGERIPFSRPPAMFSICAARKPRHRHRNNRSIAWGILPSSCGGRLGELAVTTLPMEKGTFPRPRCASSPLRLRPSLVLPLNVQNPWQIGAECSGEIERQWRATFGLTDSLPGFGGKEELGRRLQRDSPEGFRPGLERERPYFPGAALPPRQNPCSTKGASRDSRSAYLGAERGHPQLQRDGVANAALGEASVRYSRRKLGPKRWRVETPIQWPGDPQPWPCSAFGGISRHDPHVE